MHADNRRTSEVKGTHKSTEALKTPFFRCESPRYALKRVFRLCTSLTTLSRRRESALVFHGRFLFSLSIFRIYFSSSFRSMFDIFACKIPGPCAYMEIRVCVIYPAYRGVDSIQNEYFMRRIKCIIVKIYKR